MTYTLTLSDLPADARTIVDAATGVETAYWRGGSAVLGVGLCGLCDAPLVGGWCRACEEPVVERKAA